MKRSLKKFYLQNVLSFRLAAKAIWRDYNPAVFALSFVGILLVLQWLFQYQQFYEVFIANSAGLSFFSRFDVLVRALGDLFRYPDNLTPIALILLAFFQALIVVIWLAARSHAKSTRRLKLGPLGAGLVGSGCVACVSSLIGGLFSVIGTTIAASIIEFAGDILLVVAVFLAYRTFLRLGLAFSGVAKL